MTHFNTTILINLLPKIAENCRKFAENLCSHKWLENKQLNLKMPKSRKFFLFLSYIYIYIPPLYPKYIFNAPIDERFSANRCKTKKKQWLQNFY